MVMVKGFLIPQKPIVTVIPAKAGPLQKAIVIPAKAGIQSRKRCFPWPWIPAFAGMTILF